jgi:methylmalonyl-CoA mutase C-terminal domain/subunit
MARILIAKLGTDAHDMGVTVVARWLRDAGHEVIYAGLYNTPERLLGMAVEEDPDLIGLSFLGGEPVYLAGRVKELLAANDLSGLPLVVGGVVTPEMGDELRALGVAAVFSPGTGREAVVGAIGDVLAGAAA